MRERVDLKSPVLENGPPGSVRGASGNRRPYLDNYGESNTGAPLLNDSLISGCGYAALCSIAVVGARRLAVVLTDCAFRRFTNSDAGMSLGACV